MDAGLQVEAHAPAAPDRDVTRFSALGGLAGGILFSAAFTALIWYAGTHWLHHGALAPDRGNFWYEWQLLEPTAWTRATAWAGYLLHQVTLWGLIAWAQRSALRYTGRLHPVNVIALAANAFFIGLHFLQTQVWYDGLAQDVPEWTAQWSVILLLVAVVLMENQRRGLAFGYRSAYVTGAADVVRRYHGYYFAWATVYTFWYHPMENTGGHLAGFLYMFLLLLQGSLFFTRIHVNRYWMVAQELAVTAHGALVAWFAGNGWQMFLCGFLGMFVVTQMHGLGLRRGWLWFISGAYIVLVGVLYSARGFARLPEVAAIPATIIASAFLLAVLITWTRRLAGRVRQPPATPLAGRPVSP